MRVSGDKTKNNLLCVFISQGMEYLTFLTLLGHLSGPHEENCFYTKTTGFNFMKLQEP